MLDEKEFYRRFDEMVPGEAPAEGAPPGIEADIYFERLSMSGLEEMHRYSTNERLYEYFEFEPFDTIDKTRAYIEKLQQRMGGPVFKRTAMYWFVRRKNDRHLVGTAGLVELNYARKSADWSYGVDPDLWGTGYVLQIQELLKHHAFEVLQLNRISGITMVENHRTISSVLLAGMKHEGTLRQFYCRNGVFHDAWLYGMVREDYARARDEVSRAASGHTIEDVIRVVASVLPEEEIGAESSMENVSSWDSLNHMDIVLAIAEETGVTLSPTETMRATSVRAIAAIVTKNT
jgi:ribosomal-protein-alanine N-acetyltransferase